VSLWIESHQTLRDHPRKDKLAEDLFGGMYPDEVADCATVGLLHHLWWWALDYAGDGDLSGFSDRQIAKASRYGGDPRLLVEALVAAGFLTSDRRLHDWHDYAGRLIEKREANAARNRAYRASKRAASASRARHERTPSAVGDALPDLTTPLKPISSSADAADGASAVDNSGRSATGSNNNGFADFWAAYPRKVGKAETERRWSKLTGKSRKAALTAAGHLAAYASGAGTELRFIPHPSTFIGPKRIYEDWSRGAPDGYGAKTATAKRDMCPECETDLTFDEQGRAHCPYCDWRPA